MLIITRKAGERITIGDDIVVTIIEVKGSLVKLGIDAPRSVSVHRQEIYDKIREQNIKASEIDESDLTIALSIINQNISDGDSK
ncbi:MAG: carbon storage regulator CsrA [Desulfobacterium sp.]|nr:carbon storage regulator CsrA [Desulfobacterium sp.]MBU3948936.1 carbon storage regulator CsrA [Pseudomonadota bacterium]MBU4009232.1 carbon storage regulator CsrA [Pseudomonadota bacterium]MBU4035773.1 carbon storage regulator CsrA [Pseudomonadota bacterium]